MPWKKNNFSKPAGFPLPDLNFSFLLSNKNYIEDSDNNADSVLASVHCSEGIVKKKNGEFSQAIACFSKALEVDNSHVPSLLNRAFCKTQLMDYQSALQDYTRALLLSTTWEESVEAYYNRGLTQALLDNLKDAMSDFNYVIKLNPEYANAYYNRSIVKGKLGDYSGELKDINKVISLRPNDISAYNSRGIVKSLMGEYHEAEKDFNQAIHLDNTYADAWFNRAIVYWELKNYSSALSDFDKAIELNPDAESFNRRGNVKIKLNDLRGAFDDYTNAIKIQPKYYIAYLNRGYLKFDLKDYQSAMEDFSLAIKYKPDCSLAYFHRGLVKGKLNDVHGEIADYSRAIVCRPDFQDAYYQRGTVKYANGEKRDGCQDLNKAVKLGHRQAYEFLVEYCK